MSPNHLPTVVLALAAQSTGAEGCRASRGGDGGVWDGPEARAPASCQVEPPAQRAQLQRTGALVWALLPPALGPPAELPAMAASPHLAESLLSHQHLSNVSHVPPVMLRLTIQPTHVVSGTRLSKQQPHTRVSSHNIRLYENKAMGLVLLTQFPMGIHRGPGRRAASSGAGGASHTGGPHRLASDRVQWG